MFKSQLVAVITVLSAALGLSAEAKAQEDEGPQGPVQRDFVSALTYAVAYPHASPAGANDWTCQPSAAHPLPVVLVHGTAENAYDNWAQLSPLLAQEGYCVFAPHLGGYEDTAFRALTDIPASAQELSDFVDRVLSATGAAQVDLVGHSQGGMMPRYYLKYLGGAPKVNKLIALSPSNHGTNALIVGQLVASLPVASQLVGLACLACEQQLIGSSFLRDLNAEGETVPGVAYTVIATAYDGVVTPFTNTFLRAPGVTNILLQSLCILDATDHLGISYDPIALQLVLNALDPQHARRPACVVVPPLFS